MNLPSLTHYFPLVIGFFTLLIGILAVAQPEKMSKNFGIQARGITLPYVISTGIRDVFIGFIVLILFYLQSWNALGVVHLCIGVVAVSDFLVVSKYGDRRTSFVHLSAAIVVVVYGSWLLF